MYYVRSMHACMHAARYAAGELDAAFAALRAVVLQDVSYERVRRLYQARPRTELRPMSLYVPLWIPWIYRLYYNRVGSLILLLSPLSLSLSLYLTSTLYYNWSLSLRRPSATLPPPARGG